MKSNLTAYILAVVLAGIVFSIVLSFAIKGGNIKSTEPSSRAQLNKTEEEGKFGRAVKRSDSVVNTSFNIRSGTDVQMKPESQ